MTVLLVKAFDDVDEGWCSFACSLMLLGRHDWFMMLDSSMSMFMSRGPRLSAAFELMFMSRLVPDL